MEEYSKTQDRALRYNGEKTAEKAEGQARYGITPTQSDVLHVMDA